jgi:hypothetical protein
VWFFEARCTEEDLVPVVQAHAKSKHGMDVTLAHAIAQLNPYKA